MKPIQAIIFYTFVILSVSVVSAHADTYVGGANNSVYTTVNINKSAYSPNEPILVTTSVVVTGSTATPITLTAATTSNPLLTIISQTVNPSTAVYANGTLTAPASAGAYAVNFETGVDAPVPTAVPTISGVNVYSVCYNNNDCDIQADAALDIPARASGESFDITYKYNLCSTNAGCNPGVYTGSASFSFSPGETYVHVGLMGTPGAEPQIQTHCVETSTATVSVPIQQQC
jgi:hypothetical protein